MLINIRYFCYIVNKNKNVNFFINEFAMKISFDTRSFINVAEILNMKNLKNHIMIEMNIRSFCENINKNNIVKFDSIVYSKIRDVSITFQQILNAFFLSIEFMRRCYEIKKIARQR